VEALLNRDQPVDLMLDGGWRMAARVADVGRDSLDLAPLDTPLALPGPLRWCGATVTWATKLGSAHRYGLLVAGPSPGTLRLHAAGDPLQQQRRRYVRVPAEMSAVLIAPDQRLVTRTIDLSVGGMLVTSAEGLALRDPVRFALNLGNLSISGDGEIVRGTVEGLRAVRFRELQGRVDRALSRYVATRQRELINPV
jgi:hypothetical protein